MRKRDASGRMKRTVGWLLSAFLLMGYFSPQAQALRALPMKLSIASGQTTAITSGFPLSVSVSGDIQAISSTDDSRGGSAPTGTVSLVAGETGVGTATISLFGLFPLREVEVEIRDDLTLYPGGQAVGVALRTEGVLVVGVSDLTGAPSPARLAGLKAGDVITGIGGVSLEGAAQLGEYVAANGDAPLPLIVRRGDSTLRLTLSPKKDGQAGVHRIGAWVRDSTAGVGTLSFYGEAEPGGGLRYGALGHAVTDVDTKQVLTVGHGEILLADVVDVRKGKAGAPGELKGSFLRENRVLGGISLNNVFGIYGAMQNAPAHPLYPDGLPIGRKDAVHTGKASILSTVDGSGMKEYEVEIVEVARQNAPAQRSMIVKVVDEELLAKTGGIVQGMSGSPILQDGRLIGAVTHVFVNDPTMGYGLFIEWMIHQG